jgi:hypothetical protein
MKTASQKDVRVTLPVGSTDGTDWNKNDPEYTSVLISSPSPNPKHKGSVFLDITLATTTWDGRKSFEEFDGHVQPGQIDKMIEALTLAREGAVKIGLLPGGGAA